METESISLQSWKHLQRQWSKANLAARLTRETMTLNLHQALAACGQEPDIDALSACDRLERSADLLSLQLDALACRCIR